MNDRPLSNNYHPDPKPINTGDPVWISSLKIGDKFQFANFTSINKIYKKFEQYVLVERYDGWMVRVYELDKMVYKQEKI